MRIIHSIMIITLLLFSFTSTADAPGPSAEAYLRYSQSAAILSLCAICNIPCIFTLAIIQLLAIPATISFFCISQFCSPCAFLIASPICMYSIFVHGVDLCFPIVCSCFSPCINKESAFSLNVLHILCKVALTLPDYCCTLFSNFNYLPLFYTLLLLLPCFIPVNILVISAGMLCILLSLLPMIVLFLLISGTSVRIENSIERFISEVSEALEPYYRFILAPCLRGTISSIISCPIDLMCFLFDIVTYSNCLCLSSICLVCCPICMPISCLLCSSGIYSGICIGMIEFPILILEMVQDITFQLMGLYFEFKMAELI